MESALERPPGGHEKDSAGAPLQEQLRSRLAALGFDEVRFAAVSGVSSDPLREWLQAGMHADMAWMERTADKRLQPDLVLPGVRSMILLGVNYWSASLPKPAGNALEPR